MTLKEAYKILGAAKSDDPRDIKTKYKKLLILYHPDSDPFGKRDPDDDDKIRQVIEAYKKIRESEGESGYDPYEFTWDAFENKRAFSERNIYVQFKMYDEELPLSKMARGRFVWDPDMEEFRLFSKSVLEACKEAMTDHDAAMSPDLVKDIFHLMMQEYILPGDCARKLGKKISEDDNAETYAFTGFVKGETLSFDEDELYYVVLPLLENPEIKSHKTVSDRMKATIELTIPKEYVDSPVSNKEKILARLQGL